MDLQTCLKKMELVGVLAFATVDSEGAPQIRNISAIHYEPDAVICWMGNGACDPRITTDVNWKTFIGQASGESYSFEWHGGIPVTVIIQPSERSGGIRVAID